MKSRLLTPEAIDRLQNLSLFAHWVVEGFLAGLHRSPYHGFSLEFAEYRQYTPGDDLRYFEWKTLGKSDRCYIKKFRSETNMRAHLLVDCSASMGYASGPVSKLGWGAALAAALVHLLIRQHDAVSLTLFADRVMHRLPPGSGPGHRRQAMTLLEGVEPGRATRLGRILHRIAETLPHRGMVILLSDLFDDPGEVIDGLNHLAFRRHEVLVFQVLDPAERDFPFSGWCEFEDLETGARIQAFPDAVRLDVRDEVERFILRLQKELAEKSIDHRVALTSEGFDAYLARYLHARMRGGGWSF